MKQSGCLAASVAAALTLLLLTGCGNSADETNGAAVTSAPNTNNPVAGESSEPTEANAPDVSDPSTEDTDADDGYAEEPEDVEPDASDLGVEPGSLADRSGVTWTSCSPPEEVTDWAGNSFTETVCETADGETVSFYEYDSSEYEGMLQEYTDTAHVTPTWTVAASNSATLRLIVSGLS